MEKSEKASLLARPFLRWAGSKRKLLPKLAPFWKDTYSSYIEPFLGSGCLFFALHPEKSILSDINVDLVELFECIRDAPEEIYSRLQKIPRTKKSYYRIRAKNPTRMTLLNRATRFIYLNRNCFNGLYRTNLKGQFNVPFAGTLEKVGRYPSQNDLMQASHLLQNVVLQCGDFESIVRNEVSNNDFVYLDPPYVVSNRRVFREYDAVTFSFGDLERLASLMVDIDEKGAVFVLSYADCQLARDIFRKWSYMQVKTRRNISGSPMHRKNVGELIISNIL